MGTKLLNYPQTTMKFFQSISALHTKPLEGSEIMETELDLSGSSAAFPKYRDIPQGLGKAELCGLFPSIVLPSRYVHSSTCRELFSLTAQFLGALSSAQELIYLHLSVNKVYLPLNWKYFNYIHPSLN